MTSPIGHNPLLLTTASSFPFMANAPSHPFTPTVGRLVDTPLVLRPIDGEAIVPQMGEGSPLGVVFRNVLGDERLRLCPPTFNLDEDQVVPV